MRIRDHDRGYAFTIVELLVVVAVLSVLASVILPVLQKSKEASKASDCVGNLRQIYLAFALHADENEDYFPFTCYWWRTLGNEGYFGKGALHGAVTTPGPGGWTYKEVRWPTLRCAAEKGVYFNTGDPNCKQPNPLTTGFDSDLDHCSYALQWSINRNCGYRLGACGPTSKLPRKGFTGSSDNPGGRSAAPLVMDKCAPMFGWVPNCLDANIDNADVFANSGCGGGCYYAFRHPGGTANVLYLDGHVGTFRHRNETGRPSWVDVWVNEPFEP